MLFNTRARRTLPRQSVHSSALRLQFTQYLEQLDSSLVCRPRGRASRWFVSQKCVYLTADLLVALMVRETVQPSIMSGEILLAGVVNCSPNSSRSGNIGLVLAPVPPPRTVLNLTHTETVAQMMGTMRLLCTRLFISSFTLSNRTLTICRCRVF